MELLTTNLLLQMDEEGEEFRQNFVILDRHQDFPDRWYVHAFDESFFYEVEDQIGRYRSISTAQIDSFTEICKNLNKKVVWTENPETDIRKHLALNDTPEVSISSPFDDTVNGFLPFQVQGFNFLKDLEGGVVEWSTGTGKTVIASALLKYHWDKEDFDLALFVVKSHNAINTQRSLKRLVDIDSTVIKGNKKKREKLYEEAKGKRSVLVLNYEKFRVDTDLIQDLVIGGERVFIIWDEMPTKLKNRSSQMYKSVVKCLYETHPPQVSKDRQRAELRQYMLSATPIENNPEDFFNCVRIIDPTVYGTVKDFRDEYVKRFDFFDRSKPAEWHNLDKMGLKAAHMIHQVDKHDEDIAKMFPQVISEPYFIDWNDKQRSVYDSLIKEARKADPEDMNPLAVITILQMICDLPTMVLNSAAAYEAFEAAFQDALSGGPIPDKSGSELALQIVNSIGKDKIVNEGHAKLEVLKSLITEVHPNEKITIFSAFNNGLMPDLRNYLNEWGVSHVYYGGSSKQRQEAEDEFKSNSEVRVFLSSDAGSDSINLEVGSVCIHYDMPWKWSTYTQRENRIHRVTSNFETVRFYTLLMADSVEDRKLKVVLDKMGYHDAIFKGAIADQAISQRMTKEDLMYILEG